MALDLEISSSQYAYTASPAITAVPFTVSAWVKIEASMGSSGVVGGLFDTATDTNYHHLNVSTLTPRASSDAAISIQSAPWGSAVSTAVWVHLLATFGPTAGVDRNISVNGGTFVQSTTNRAAASLDTFGIGARKSLNPALFFDGLIAFVCVWDVQLSQGEALALARGTHPLSIRSSDIAHYWPLLGDENDRRGGKNLTLVGSPVFVEDSPPVHFYMARTIRRPYAIAVAAGGVTGAGALASLEAFGTTKVVRIQQPVALGSAEAFGTADHLTRVMQPVAISSAQALGTSRVRLNANPVGVPTLEAFGRLTINRLYSVGNIASAEAFGQADHVLFVAKPVGIASSQAFGRPFLVTTFMYPAAIASAESFGQSAHVVRILAELGIASATAFGDTHVADRVYPTGIASSQALGQVAHVTRILAAQGIASAQALGGADHVLFRVYPLGVASATAFGMLDTGYSGGPGAYPITAAGAIASLEAFGQADRINFIVRGTGLASAQAFGQADVLRNVRQAGGIASLQALGTAAHVGRLLEPVGLASPEAFGSAELVRIIRQAGGIASSQAFGTTDVLRSLRQTAGIPSAEAFGQLAHVVRVVKVTSIATGETWGAVIVTGGVPVSDIISVFGSVGVADTVRYEVVVADGELYVVSVRDSILSDVLVGDQIS